MKETTDNEVLVQECPSYLGQFQMGSYRYTSLLEGLYTL